MLLIIAAPKYRGEAVAPDGMPHRNIGQPLIMVKDEDQDRVASKQIVAVLGWVGEVSRIAANG